MHGDRGDIVVGWLTRITLVLAVLGVIGFEVVSIGVGRVRAQDIANNAAREGSEVWQRTRDVQQAYLAASAVVAESSGEVAPEDFLANSDGSVTITVCRESSSVLLYRAERSRKWLRACEQARAKFVA